MMYDNQTVIIHKGSMLTKHILFHLQQIPVNSKKKLCPKSGVFPYENDCQTFFKCKRSMSGKMQGKSWQELGTREVMARTGG